MRISLEFDSVQEWVLFINSFNKGEVPIPIESVVVKKEEEPVIKEPFGPPVKPSRKIKDKKKFSSFERQILKVVKYAKKNNVDFGRAVKRVLGRYANNWDYEIAERLGYKFPRQKKTIYQEEAEKMDFITKRTRMLADTGWDFDEARKAAKEAWETGQRDPEKR